MTTSYADQKSGSPAVTPSYLHATHCDWMSRLAELIARHPEYCIEADLAGMTEDERWKVYRFLRRVAEEARG